MNERGGGLDWLAFLTRIVVEHDRVGAFLVIGIGYFVFPLIAYLYTRYCNLKFMGGLVEAVRRRFAGRRDL
jgi:hypothetical protein